MPFTKQITFNVSHSTKLTVRSFANCQLSIVNCLNAFSLIELMLVVGMMAVLTASVIPSFKGFSQTQSLYQSFKTLKSDLRVAQARSLSGAAVSGGAGKAWGVHFPPTPSSIYTIFTCAPVSSLSQYSQYTYSACGGAASAYKTVSLGPSVSFVSLSPVNAQGLDVVFDAQNGATVGNGAIPSGNVTIILQYAIVTSSRQTLTITQAGGIVD